MWLVDSEHVISQTIYDWWMLSMSDHEPFCVVDAQHGRSMTKIQQMLGPAFANLKWHTAKFVIPTFSKHLVAIPIFYACQTRLSVCLSVSQCMIYSSTFLGRHHFLMCNLYVITIPTTTYAWSCKHSFSNLLKKHRITMLMRYPLFGSFSFFVRCRLI